MSLVPVTLEMVICTIINSQMLVINKCQEAEIWTYLQVSCLNIRAIRQMQHWQNGNERHGAGCLGMMDSSTRQIRMICKHQASDNRSVVIPIIMPNPNRNNKINKLAQ